MYELIFLDMDGTLKQEPEGISQRNKEAILLACKAGKKVSIASGRNKTLIMPTVKELQLDQFGQSYSVALNGALIIDNRTGSTLHSVPISFELVRQLFKTSFELGIHCHVYTENNVYFAFNNQAFHWYQSQGCNCILVDKESDTLGIRETPLKAFIQSKNRDELVLFQRTMAPFAEGQLTAEYSSLYSLEYTSVNASKGLGLAYVCKQFQLPIEKAIAAGDGENDMSMLQMAGLGVAMKNALDTVKAVADTITERTCKEDGVTEIIYKYLLALPETSN